MSQEAHVFGSHRLSMSGNVSLLEPKGAMNGEEARAIVNTVQSWIPNDKPCYLLFDGANLSSLSPDGRKAFVEWIQRRSAPEYVSYFNISFAVSTLLFLMLNAARLFGRTPDARTFGTEAEARAWLASLGAVSGG